MTNNPFAGSKAQNTVGPSPNLLEIIRVRRFDHDKDYFFVVRRPLPIGQIVGRRHQPQQTAYEQISGPHDTEAGALVALKIAQSMENPA